MNNIYLKIENNGSIYQPILENYVYWTTYRQAQAGVLQFNVLKDDIIDFQEGNSVEAFLDGNMFFKGYVFTKSRNKDGIISVTAYDQLRYLMNKDSSIYYNCGASDVIKSIAAAFSLKTGEIESCSYKVASYVADNEALADTILSLIDMEYEATGKLFVLYDDCGKLCFKNVEGLRTNYLCDKTVCSDFFYETSIDKNVYNKIKLIYEDGRKGIREVTQKQSSETVDDWGILQLNKNISEDVEPQSYADALLKQYNRKIRTLEIKEAVGDIGIRGGSLICVKIELGDIIANYYMIVESVTHCIGAGSHTMDMSVKGGLING